MKLALVSLLETRSEMPFHPYTISTEALEIAVLSYMMWNPGKVEGLTGEEFTCPIRRSIYSMLLSGMVYEQLGEELHRQDVTSPEYLIRDILYSPTLADDYVIQAIAELQRSHRISQLHDDVRKWLRRTEPLTFEVACSSLVQVITKAARRR